METLSTWESIKAWFKHSWTILIARLEVLTGILTGAVAGIDWTALSSLDWSQGIKSTNAMFVAGFFLIKGIISEIARRAGTVETVDSRLVPTAIVTEAKVDTSTIQVK